MWGRAREWREIYHFSDVIVRNIFKEFVMGEPVIFGSNARGNGLIRTNVKVK